MQWTDRDCHVCKQSIHAAVTATGCTECDQAFHKHCLDDESVCPTCGQVFAAMRHKEDEREKRDLRESIQQGRLFTIFVVAAVVGTYLLLSVCVAFVPEQELPVLSQVKGQIYIRTAVVGAVGLLVFTGRRWALYIFRFLLFLNLAGSIAWCAALVESRDLEAWHKSILISAAVVFSLVYGLALVASFSGKITLFLDYLRDPVGVNAE